ncbi:hypothetical protein MBANPS3_012636, partial [Mucor bainieri]
MAFATKWMNLSQTIHKWTKQAVFDFERFSNNAFDFVNDYYNQQVPQDIKYILKQAAEKFEGLGKQSVKAYKDLIKELHNWFAGVDNLARLSICDELLKEVDSIKANHRKFLFPCLFGT